MRSKSGGKENNNAPMSPQSPRSPSIPEFASPNAPFHQMPESPASPKPRKDSKNIFSNFGATKSSSKLNMQDTSNRGAYPAQQPSPTLYTNGRGGSSTPDLSRPVRTPNSDGMHGTMKSDAKLLTCTDNRSEIVRLDQRTGSGKSTEADGHADSTKGKGTQSKKQGKLFRSKSIKGDENAGSRSKLNKAPPGQLSPDPGATWTTNGDGTPLKIAPTDKGKTWGNKPSFGKLRTHSADRHDAGQLVHRESDSAPNGPRRDKSEQGSLQSNSYNDNRGASLMSSLGSGARKMGDKMDSARKGIFGKLGRSHSNHESPTHVSNEPYVYKVIHTPLVEQTRLTRISSRLEQSRDKTEFWMPALPWRCIDYLNMRGCEEEGLYRVPGSAQQVRYYERKFDQGKSWNN